MTTVFDIPTQPDEFGVVLQPAQLRRLNFSALDYATMRRASIEYIKAYFPEEFNDFVANNGIVMLIELFSYIAGNLSQRSDILVEESFLPTARTLTAVINHLALINQRVRRQTPAVVDLEISIGNPLPTQLNIPAGTTFSLTGSDGLPLQYEVYRAPGDFLSNVSIPPGKRGIVGFGIEGSFAPEVIAVSAGGSNQTIDIVDNDILEDPFIVEVATGSTSVTWRRVQNIERAEPNDEVYEVRLGDNVASIVFGDDQAGKSPLSGQVITTRYRRGGGIRGRIGRLTIDESRSLTAEAPANAPIDVLFRNPNPSSGGRDAETAEQAKRRAPKEAATLNSATSGEDYAQLSSTFTHPVFGSVLKAIATVRTGVETSREDLAIAVRAAATVEEAVEILDAQFVNQNIVEVYILAEGPLGVPVLPSAGLRQGLKQFFDAIKVLTDDVRVLDGVIKQVDFRANIQISRSADASAVKEQVNVVVDDFFDAENFDMGEPFYLSNLYREIEQVPGVRTVAIFEPADDIIRTRKLADPAEDGVGLNEMITLGKKEMRFFFEKIR